MYFLRVNKERTMYSFTYINSKIPFHQFFDAITLIRYGIYKVPFLNNFEILYIRLEWRSFFFLCSTTSVSTLNSLPQHDERFSFTGGELYRSITHDVSISPSLQHEQRLPFTR